MIDSAIQAQLRKEYNPEGSELRKYQLRLLEMLVFIDNVCTKHHINYILSSGTLLGAVRHEGFIPWDDDVDIEMELPEYKRFLNVLTTELEGTDYVLQDFENDTFYKHPFSKLRDKKSIIKDSENKDLKYNGCFIDIFPMIYRNLKLSEVSVKLVSFFLYNLDFKIIPLNIKGWYFKTIKKFLYKFLFVSFQKYTAPSPFVYHLYGVVFNRGRHLSYYYPIRRIKFEDHFFNAPNDIDGYLTDVFGQNYNSLPPKESIKFHLVDFSLE